MAASDSSKTAKAGERTVNRALKIIEGRLREPGASIGHRSDVEAYLRIRFAGLEREVFLVLFLDTKNRLLVGEEMFQGTLTQTGVYPREVARRALQLNAAAVILAHNHPSGDAAPSRADMVMTEAVRLALSPLEIQVLDHVVVGAKQAVSFAELSLPPFGNASFVAPGFVGMAVGQDDVKTPATTVPATAGRSQAAATTPALDREESEPLRSIPVYQLAANADANDILDRIVAKIDQLDASMDIITGEGFENFARYNNDIQGRYLWAIQDSVEEVKELLRNYNKARRRGTPPAGRVKS